MSQPLLEENHNIPPSMLDEALFPYSASRSIPTSLSKLDRRLDSLYATQGVPQNTSRN